MREILNSLEAKNRERAYLLEILGLWDIVKQAGIDPEDVHAFTFRPEYLERRKRWEYNKATQAEKISAGVNWKNCVRMKDGSLKEISLTRSPKCP